MTKRPSERVVTISKGDDCWRGQFQAMASPCEILCKSDDAAEAGRLVSLAADEAWRVEDKFSRYIADNAIAAINTAKGRRVTVDVETAQLLDFAKTLHDLSNGLFDITSGVLRRVWTFDGSDRLPSSESVAQVLQSVGWHRAVWASPNFQLEAGMEIDFGGIGKEYAVDKVAGLLKLRTDAACLVNFGGDVFACGELSESNGWQVGIKAHDADDDRVTQMVQLKNGALATSGDAHRFILNDGIRYGHILDPTTGWPVEDAPRSVTVAADTCTEAGMMATMAMLKGAGAEEFLEQQGLQYWCYR